MISNSMIGIIIGTSLAFCILLFILVRFIYKNIIKKPNKDNENIVVGTQQSTDGSVVNATIGTIVNDKEKDMQDKLVDKFSFSSGTKKYYFILPCNPIGSLMNIGNGFYAGLVEQKGKLWLENKQKGFFAPKPDERQLCIINKREGFIFKQIGNQWLQQGYDLNNGKNNNIYTVDEQSDFLRTIEAKYWQYQGHLQINKDKWAFWGLVILAMLIVFGLGMNAYTTNKFMSNVEDFLDNEILDDTDKALMLDIIKNQNKLVQQNQQLITQDKTKQLNSNLNSDNQEGITFK